MFLIEIYTRPLISPMLHTCALGTGIRRKGNSEAKFVSVIIYQSLLKNQYFKLLQFGEIYPHQTWH